MSVSMWQWAALVGMVVVLIVVDLLLFGRGEHEVSFRRALVWTMAWTTLGVAFAAVVWAWDGRTMAGQYLAGYLIERTLSMDNLLVFALIFAYFAVPYGLQPTVLMYGVVGALGLRLVFILVGVALLDAVHWVIYLFGAFLVYTAVRLARAGGEEVDPSRNPLLNLIRRRLRMTDHYRGTKLVVRQNHRTYATPLVAVLAVVATTDVVFAVDSIPAIFAVTRQSFVVFAANAFAMMGLRALYFLLAGAMRRFEYLGKGLAVLLALVGAKMLVSGVYEPPLWSTLVAIVVVLAGAIGFSLHATRRVSAH